MIVNISKKFILADKLLRDDIWMFLQITKTLEQNLTVIPLVGQDEHN